MGSLRLVLAISVVICHVPGETLAFATGGDASVQCFYVVSGFFITLILNEKYVLPSDDLLFYTNRLIRIFSLYWLFLGLAAFVALVGYVAAHRGVFATWEMNSARLTLPDAAFLIFANVFIFGQDLTLFLGPTDSGLQWTTAFYRFMPDTTKFMIVSPAWSLALELYFYALAPFIVRKSLKAVAALIVGSLVLRLAFYLNGLQDDPWTYRFFPFELALFLAGAVSYHIYARIRDRKLAPWAIAFGWSALGAVLAYPVIDAAGGAFFAPARLAFFAYFVVALPFLFKQTSAVALDRQAGDLSYPVYLCHMIFIELLQGVPQLAPHPHIRTLIALVCSIALSYVVARRIEAPIDRFRQGRVEARSVVAPRPSVA